MNGSYTQLDIYDFALLHTQGIPDFALVHTCTANPGKFQSIFLSRSNTEGFNLNLQGVYIPCNDTIKMLGVTLDRKLNFKEHIQHMCRNAAWQINTLKRLSKFLNSECRLNVYKSFINAHFNYCPLVWMFCGKTNLRKLELLQERALKIVYKDHTLSYEDMLNRSNLLCIRTNLIRLLAIELYKSINGMNPEYINQLFKPRISKYNFRNDCKLEQKKFNTYKYGYFSLQYFGSKLWNILPMNVKESESLMIFRSRLRGYFHSVNFNQGCW